MGEATGIAGTTYLDRGEPVLVEVAWRTVRRSDPPPPLPLLNRAPAGGPRNVLVRRPDGTRQVRPFRGLRRVVAA